MKYLLIILSCSLFLYVGCTKKKVIEGPDPLPVVYCIDNLKGKTFEIYQADTQRFSKIGEALFAKGSMLIDSLNYSYGIHIFNTNADSITIKPNNGFAPKTSGFKIIGNSAFIDTTEFYYQNCTSAGYSITMMINGADYNVQLTNHLRLKN